MIFNCLEFGYILNISYNDDFFSCMIQHITVFTIRQKRVFKFEFESLFLFVVVVVCSGNFWNSHSIQNKSGGRGKMIPSIIKLNKNVTNQIINVSPLNSEVFLTRMICNDIVIELELTFCMFYLRCLHLFILVVSNNSISTMQLFACPPCCMMNVWKKLINQSCHELGRVKLGFCIRCFC